MAVTAPLPFVLTCTGVIARPSTVKVNVPVGGVWLPVGRTTVAVNRTDWPTSDGFGVEVSWVMVAVNPFEGEVTAKLRAFEMLGA